MTWHQGIVQNKRELLALIGALATSQHVATLAINAPGSGYVVGEIITIGHAGANAPATAEVLLIGGGGSVTSLVLRNWGAYADRVATATINAGGTGYVVGDILEVQTGAGRQMAKVRVDMAPAGVITAVSVFETGGAYSTTPAATGVATVGIGPSTFAGDDAATVDLTFTGLVGLVGLATTASAAGTGLTVDITLAETGWLTGSFNSMRDTNDFSVNSVNDEKQLAMRGTVTGGDEPFIMNRTGTNTPGIETNHLIGWSASDAFNPALDFDAQVGLLSLIGMTGSGFYTPMFDAEDHSVWISISARSVKVAVRTQGDTVLSYQFGYAGLGNPFATTTNNPYPLVIGSSTGQPVVFPDDTTSGRVRGPIEAYEAAGDPDPWRIRRQEDASIGFVRNSDPFGTAQIGLGVYPCMENRNLAGSTDASTITADGRRTLFDIILPTGGTATAVILPTPDTGGDLFVPIPAVILESNSAAEPVSAADKLRLEIENIFWVPGLDSAGSPIAAEDTLTDQNGDRYRVIRSGSRTEPYSMWAMKEE